MKARVRFKARPVFNSQSTTLVCPGILLGRAEDRRMWTLCFTVEQRLSDLVYEGNLTWCTAPVEHDFGKGVKFHLISDPSKYSDGQSTGGMFADGELLG
jgi:hypothetical protein